MTAKRPVRPSIFSGGLLPSDRRGRIRLALLAAALAALGPLLWMEYRPMEREWTEKVEIPPRVRVRKAWTVRRGWEVILRVGTPGTRLVRLRAKWRGGRVVEWRELSSTPLTEPKVEVRLAGASAAPNAIGAPRLTRAVRSLEMLATAYDAGPADNSFEHAGVTKLGWRTRRGIVAVDPKVIPLRSLLYVEGYGLAWAGDVGGAIKGVRLDLCFNTTEEAREWGKRKVWAYVLQGVKTRGQRKP